MTADAPNADPPSAGRASLPRRVYDRVLQLPRRLYDWVIHWAYTPYALPALILISFAESSFFPIPPDVLLIPLCLGNPKRAMRFALWCSLASVLGGIAGYGIGAWAWDSGVKLFCDTYIPGFEHAFPRVKALYADFDFWIVFTAGFSPLPYKVFTIAAGVCAIDFWTFVLASVVSRTARFTLEAVLLRHFGAPVREFIEKRFGLATLVFCVLLVGGFAAIKYAL